MYRKNKKNGKNIKAVFFFIKCVLIVLAVYIGSSICMGLFLHEYGDSIKVTVGVWRYYKQLNDMQEEMENIYMNNSVDFSEQSLSIYQKEGKWDVEVIVRGENTMDKSIFESYNIENTESIEKLNENFCEPIYHVLYDGEVYRYIVGEYESIYYIPDKEILEKVQRKMKENRMKYKKVRGKWYKIAKTKKS